MYRKVTYCRPKKVAIVSPTPPSSQLSRPSLPLVLLPYLLGVSAAAYVQIVGKADCRLDTPVSTAMFFTILFVLVRSAVFYAQVRASDIPISNPPVTTRGYIVITFSPALMYAISDWHKCSASYLSYNQDAMNAVTPALLIAIAATFVYEAILASRQCVDSIPPAKSDAGIGKYLTMPVSLIWLLLVLGSDHQFGYFADLLSRQFLDYPIYLRYAVIAGTFAVLILDAIRILSPLLAKIRPTVDALADRLFSTRDIDAKDNAVTVVSLTIINTAILVLRYIFQFLSWAGLSILFLAVSLGISFWQFIYNKSTKFTIVFVILSIISTWLSSQFVRLLASTRILLETGATNTIIITRFGYLFFFLFFVSLTYVFMTQVKSVRLTHIADACGIVAAFALMGGWLASATVHLVATVVPTTLFRAPAFAGADSLGWFFWVTLSAFALVSVLGLLLTLKATKPATS